MKRILVLLPLILLVPLVLFLYQQIQNDKIPTTQDPQQLIGQAKAADVNEVKVKNNNYQISFSQDAQNPTAEKSDETRYSQLSNGVKEEIILAKAPATPFIAKYTAILSGVKPRFFKDLWRFFDEGGREQFFIPKPFMVDQKNQRSENINLQISPISGSRYQITLTPDHDWLTSTDRTYPVIVDPSIEVPEQPIQEILAKRTQNSKTYSLPNGSFAWEGSIGPVHYKDNPDSPQEPWKEIDLTIQPIDSQSGYDYQNTANNFKSFFKKNSKDPGTVKYENNGNYITFTNQDNELGQLRSVEGYAENNRFIYPEAYDNIDIKYSIGTSVLLEEFVLKKPRDVSRISQKVHFEDAYYQKQDDGTIKFFSTKTNELVWSFPKPKMYEVNPRPDTDGLPSRFENFGLHYEITQDGSDFIVTKVLDQEGKDWLNSPNRIYPLVIDTTIDAQVGASADDAQEYVGTNVQLANSYISLFNTTEWGGLRWLAVNVPAGATIGVTYISIYVDSITWDDPDVDIYFQAANNPSTFAAVNNNISSRSRTTTKVTWTATGIGTGWKNSPSLVTPLQEVIDTQSGTGDALASIWDNRSGTDVDFYSYDFNTTYAPKLHIEYTAAATTSNIKFNGLKMEGIKIQ